MTASGSSGSVLIARCSLALCKNGTRQFFREMPVPTNCRSCLMPLKKARFSFWRRFFSPGSQRWQNWQSLPVTQPLECRKAQGLHSPVPCVTEPMLGRSWGHGVGAGDTASESSSTFALGSFFIATGETEFGVSGSWVSSPVSAVLHSEPPSSFGARSDDRAAGAVLVRRSTEGCGRLKPSSGLLTMLVGQDAT